MLKQVATVVKHDYVQKLLQLPQHFHTARWSAHQEKKETATHTLHPRKRALTVINAWNCRETLELRKM